LLNWKLLSQLLIFTIFLRKKTCILVEKYWGLTTTFRFLSFWITTKTNSEKNTTERSFSFIGCAINDKYFTFFPKQPKQPKRSKWPNNPNGPNALNPRQDDKTTIAAKKKWGYKAAQLTRSLKIVKLTSMITSSF
jgi:hypothetical protein